MEYYGKIHLSPNAASADLGRRQGYTPQAALRMLGGAWPRPCNLLAVTGAQACFAFGATGIFAELGITLMVLPQFLKKNQNLMQGREI